MESSAPATLALSVGLGAVVTLVCTRLRIPAILPLIIVGFAAGLLTIGSGEHAHPLIDAAALGDGLLAFISVSVGLLVFEGALHLDRQTLAQAPKAVRGLLTIGALVTWGACTLLARFIIGLDWDVSLLLGAVLIVTGPTVIQPILRRLPLRPNLHAALMAEGILIDPIGVIAAVSTLEIIRLNALGTRPDGIQIVAFYAKPLLAGAIIGAALGWVGVLLMRRSREGSTSDGARLNLMGMAICMLGIGMSEKVSPESGLVAAAVCGIVIANARLVGAEELRRFKEQISIVLVGTLFILLASRFRIEQFAELGWREALFVVGVILLARPLCVFSSTLRSVLSNRERLFASFLAPRGIVAASLGSIIAIEFGNMGGDYADVGKDVETLIITVIIVTVALSGALAGTVATLLGVRAGKPNGVIIVGGHRLGRDLAKELMERDIPVRLVDTNASNIAAAASWGIPTTLGDATDARWLEQEVASTQTGWVIAMTDNVDVDRVVARWAAKRYGPGKALQWFRTEPEDGPVKAFAQWGRPLRHLLFQMDMELARVETWEGEGPGGAVPLAVIDPKGDLILGDPDELADAPEGSTTIGIVFGAPKPAKPEPGKAESPKPESTKSEPEPTRPDPARSEDPEPGRGESGEGQDPEA